MPTYLAPPKKERHLASTATTTSVPVPSVLGYRPPSPQVAYGATGGGGLAKPTLGKVPGSGLEREPEVPHHSASQCAMPLGGTFFLFALHSRSSWVFLFAAEPQLPTLPVVGRQERCHVLKQAGQQGTKLT